MGLAACLEGVLWHYSNRKSSFLFFLVNPDGPETFKNIKEVSNVLIFRNKNLYLCRLDFLQLKFNSHFDIYGGQRNWKSCRHYSWRWSLDVLHMPKRALNIDIFRFSNPEHSNATGCGLFQEVLNSSFLFVEAQVIKNRWYFRASQSWLTSSAEKANIFDKSIINLIILNYHWVDVIGTLPIGNSLVRTFFPL